MTQMTQMIYISNRLDPNQLNAGFAVNPGLFPGVLAFSDALADESLNRGHNRIADLRSKGGLSECQLSLRAADRQSNKTRLNGR